MNKKIFKITITAVLTGLASAIYYFLPEIPIIPGVDYLKIDLSDLPAVIAAVAVGPIPAIIIELLKNLIHLTKTTTFGVGELCNFLVGSSLAVPFGLIFNKLRKTNNNIFKTYIYTSALSLICIIIAGLLVNLAFVPLYFKVFNAPFIKSVYIGYVLSSIPMNIVKGLMNTILAFPILIALKNTKFLSD